MASKDATWTTVSGKTKAKAPPTSTKSTPAPVIPKAEVKTIKLSDSAFSSMKDRIVDENDENEPGEVKAPKPVATTEKTPPVKITKSNKSTSNALTLKQALQNINVEKMKEVYKSSKNNTSLWIDKICYWFIEQFKDVTSGLNDPTFSKENNPEYPFSALPSSVRDYFNEIFDTQSKLKAMTLCRNGIVNPNADINNIVGYQILLQHLLRNLTDRPDVSFLDDVDKLSALLKRYPSEKVIRLLWAYNQVQYEQPSLALDIWFRLMFPLVDNRTYNQLVVDNLSQLTARNSKTKKFLQPIEVFPVKSYIRLLEFVGRSNPALTKDMRASLINSATILSELFSNNVKNLSQYSVEYFEVLFPVLHGDKQRSDRIQAAIDRMILACLADKSVIKTWLSLHKQYPQSSLDLLSLLKKNEILSKEFRSILAQLRTVSNEEKSTAEHQEFLRVYTKNDAVVVNKRPTSSKSRIGSIFKFLALLLVAFTIYSNWLWLTVAADYLLEDYLKHPIAIQIKARVSDGYKETKKLTQYAEKYTRTTINNLEPYAIKLGQNLQKQWNVVLKYIEGPVYDKSVEVAEQIQRLSVVVFNQSVRYLNTLFDLASYYTARFTSLTEVYLRQVYAIVYDQWTHFDLSELRNKFDQLRARVVKSI